MDSNSDHNKDSVHNGILALNEKYVDGATRTGYDLTMLARCIQDRRRDLKLVRKEELESIHSTGTKLQANLLTVTRRSGKLIEHAVFRSTKNTPKLGRS